ncbi:MAG: hypothetical protein CL470_04110 [Acidimicrobiaceae bacterium]|nr:hypothetical protein [Acidimicrobiaceae bacterium]|tara:strand:- start:528 stop:794 length:267 start_codon:yes stop_codon:yes gene_type:complete
MAILIDEPIWPFRGERWAHLVSDESYDELHAFADSIGISRSSFQGDHYDIPKSMWLTAVNAGALPTDSRVLLRKLKEAGLRKRNRKTK